MLDGYSARILVYSRSLKNKLIKDRPCMSSERG